MRKILIATHGEFAGGLKQTMDFVLGGNEKVGVLSAYTTPDFDMDREAAAVVDELEDGDNDTPHRCAMSGSGQCFQGISPHPGLRTGPRQCADAASHGAYAATPWMPGADYTGIQAAREDYCVYQRSDEAGF